MQAGGRPRGKIGPGMRLPALSLAALAWLAAAAAPAPPALTVTVQAQRTSLDLLDSLPIVVIAHNPAAHVATVQFPAPAEYAVDVTRDGKTLWSVGPAPPPPGVTFPPHQRAFTPGPTTIVVLDWNELTTANFSPLPGTYAVTARLLTASPPPPATMKVTFAPPLPPSALPSLKAGESVTLLGTVDATHSVLTGETGASAPLNRKLIAAPPGVPILVRGYATDNPNGTRVFTMTRWAAYGAPLPLSTPTPAPIRRTFAPMATPSPAPMPAATHAL